MVEYKRIELDDGKLRDVGYLVFENKAEVIAGRYGLDTSGNERFVNDVTFFSLWIGDRGGWSVKMFRSDEQVPLHRDLQVTIARDISVNPRAAMERFGIHFHRCGLCGRALTKTKGPIGPICEGYL
jgi:hypothetical protein